MHLGVSVPCDVCNIDTQWLFAVSVPADCDKFVLADLVGTGCIQAGDTCLDAAADVEVVVD